ncbi:MAG: glycosyltransferase family 4 protein [Spirochaetes bacterium]|nr:glycosyltransferase family 4 protein [Spirochaetota bacterium]
MDFRKYDGVVGGVEQGVIQITTLFSSLQNEVVLLCKKKRISAVRSLFEGNRRVKVVPLDVETHVMSAKNRRLDSTTIPRIAEQEGAQVIHFPYNWSFPVRKAVPTVLTVHDVIPFTFREAQGLYTNLVKYKPGMRKTCRLNDMIVTVSEFSRQDISRKVGVSLEKIRVIYNGLRSPNPQNGTVEESLRKRLDLRDRFLLNVGGIHERKNVPRLIRAFSLLTARSGYKGKLVITGKVSGAPYQEKMKRICDAAVKDVGMKERVVFTSYVSEPELDELFRMADLLIYPSLYEGFGIPVIEAMNAGLPVITSNSSALPEVAGGAALLTAPEDTEDMSRKMERLLSDESLKKELIKKGKDRCSSFTWEKTAREYLALYREAVSSGRGTNALKSTASP